MSNWIFPLIDYDVKQLPMLPHPGAFSAKRKHDMHTGVDLYVNEKRLVRAVEGGICVGIENYTGPEAGSPWWLPTKSILVEGPSGVVCYGEISPMGPVQGNMIMKGQIIGRVIPVLPEGKERIDVPGHSRFMLHLELYKKGTRESVWWYHNTPQPDCLLDPTNFLKTAMV